MEKLKSEDFFKEYEAWYTNETDINPFLNLTDSQLNDPEFILEVGQHWNHKKVDADYITISPQDYFEWEIDDAILYSSQAYHKNPLQYAGEALRNDPEFVISYYETIREVDGCLGNELSNDKNFAKKAMESHDFSLSAFSDSLKADSDLVHVALDISPDNIRFADSSIKDDKGLVIKTIEKSNSAILIFDGLNDELKNDPEIALAAMERRVRFEDCGERLKSDKEFILGHISKNPEERISYSINEELKNDKEFVQTVYELSPVNIMLGEGLKNDTEFILKMTLESKHTIPFEFDIFAGGEGVLSQASSHIQCNIGASFDHLKISKEEQIEYLQALNHMEKQNINIDYSTSIFEQKQVVDLAEKIASELEEKNKIKDGYYNKLGGGQSQEKRIKL